MAAACVMVSPLSLAADQSASEAEAKALLERGTELRRAGRDEEALDVFNRADSLHPSPRAHAQVALAEQALGRWVAAEKDLSRALEADNDPWIKRNRTILFKALEGIRQHVGKLAILGSPVGAVVQVNGELAGTLPLPAPVSVAAGDVVIRVEAPRRAPISRRVTISGGELARETIDLPPAESASADPGPMTIVPAPPAVPASVDLGTSPANAASEPVTSRPSFRTAAWITAGLGAAALAIGIVADVRYVHNVGSFNAPDSGCANTAPNRGTGAGCSATYNAFTEEKPGAITAFATAGVLGVTSAILFWTGHGETTRHTLACSALGRGGSCGFVF
jgi:hypothetical protein